MRACVCLNESIVLFMMCAIMNDMLAMTIE